MTREYTEEEKQEILQELGIMLLNGMLNSGQAVQVLSKRAEIETGQWHPYRDDTIRHHVKNERLPVAAKVHGRMNLFNVDDVFALSLAADKWRASEPRPKKVRKKETIKTDTENT